jgi:hypothetical protein
MTVWNLDMAGLAVELDSLPPLAALNADRLQLFRSAGGKKGIRVHFHQIEKNELSGRRPDPEKDPLWSGAGRRGTRSPLLRSLKVRERLAAAGRHTDRLFIEILPESLSILDFECNRADYFFLSASRSKPTARWIGPAMLAPFLPNFNALLLHASAIALNGRAAVFLAADEGGKTTAVRLSPQGTILGDDQVLVRRVRGGFRVSGTPWGLHVAPGMRVPLAGLFLLEKAGRFALEPLPVLELAAHVWEESKNPLSMLPKPLKKKAFAVICAMAAAVPAWKLGFAKHHIDWEAIDRAMALKRERRT